MKVAVIILAVLACVFLLVTFGGGYYMYRFAIVRQKKKDYWKEEFNPPDYFTEEEKANVRRGEAFIRSHTKEIVEIQSHDGLKLSAHLIENENPVGLIIMVHGYRSHPIFDFSCAVEPFYAYGYSMLLIDHRAHGYSEGRHIGFGVTERHDLVRWAQYAKARWENLPVIFDGVSMGGATTSRR